MATGRTFPTTATSGFRMSQMVGFRIATETGFMNPTTVGRGLGMNLGDGHRITMAAGFPMEVRGRGGRARCMQGITRSGRPLTFRSLDGAADSDSELGTGDGAVSAGYRSDLAITTIRGGVDTVDALA
jgi:hypothetical protein